MHKYEVWYVEIRYRDESRTWMTSSNLKSLPFGAVDDSEAVPLAKKLLDIPSDDPLVDRKIFNKLVRVIEIN